MEKPKNIYLQVLIYINTKTYTIYDKVVFSEIN
jgi:hypothetical protein